MKTRQGFVSNSSSSSFMVFWPREPKSYEDVFEMMYNGTDDVISVYDQKGYALSEISKIVWNDIDSGTALKVNAVSVNMLPTLENHVLYEFTYSDDNEIGNVMEHGDIFRNLFHVVESNH